MKISLALALMGVILFARESNENLNQLKPTTMENVLNIPAKDLQFPELPYSYDALEPSIDKMTMEIHYTKHHRAYYDNMMKFITETGAGEKNLKEIFSEMEKYPAGLRNNAGGYFNHLLFWQNLRPGESQPGEKLLKALEGQWGSLDKFKEEFNAAAATRFGSGWAWLSVDEGGKLFISSTPNQDNPLMSVTEKKGTPLLCLDVWEHAYYLKYQNKRAAYVEAWWNVVNWADAAARLAKAQG